jgi:hypothetical protein
MKYLIAVPSAMIGAPIVLASGRPVLYLGGFLGSDNVVNAYQLAGVVQQNQLRYILDTGQLQNEKPQIYQWLTTSCQVASDAPALQGLGSFPGGFARGGSGPAIYDCQH